MNGTIYLRDNAWFQREGVIKMGIATFAKDRSSTYITGEVQRGEYICVIEIPLDKMRLLDVCSKNYFKPYHIYKGGGTEFYDRCLIELLVPYLQKMNITYKVLSSEEILLMNRCERLKMINKTVFNTLTLKKIKEHKEKSIKEEFFNTFLPNKIPRRIQLELWDIWNNIGDTYKGIIQWPTGTGKTIAMMILFFLTFQKCKKKGKLFRCLLIAPTNDIFDTLMHTILKLEKWNIIICEGHHGNLSSLVIPVNKNILITATHASLTGDHWNKLPEMTMVHYDEVHRITGHEFNVNLVKHIDKWNPYLTGTSATPKTCDAEQHQKLYELFGNPLQIIHRCDVDEAISEGWIATPRFGVHIVSKNNIHEFVAILKSNIELKKQKCWKGGKCIAYLPTRLEVLAAEKIAKDIIPEATIYSTETKTDPLFVSDKADGTIRILFACERYREGSDIYGIEMTTVLMGDKIGAHIILQIAGRGLRNDYENKEGWCVIVRPSEEGVTEDEVFDSILFQIMVFINHTSPTKEKVRHVVTKFFGEVSICGKIYNIEETIQRIQSMYLREKTKKEKYSIIRLLNQEMNVQTKQEYEKNPKIDNPKEYFKEPWISWYHFLGVDTSLFPTTKMEWVSMCKEKGIQTWEEYKQKKILPLNPCEMYEDFTNWDKEMGMEEEIIW